MNTTQAWIWLLHPLHFVWLPAMCMALAAAGFCWTFRDGFPRGHGHIVGVGLLMALGVSALGWAIYGAGALIWWLAA